MLLAKAQGGTTVAGHTWENDGDAVDVPVELAVELLAIPGGDFSVPDDQDVPLELSAAPRSGRKGGRSKAVTEPTPEPAAAAVTEPEPDSGPVAEDGAGPAGEKASAE